MNWSRLPPLCHGNQTTLVPIFVHPSQGLHLVSAVLGTIALALSLACLVFNIILRNNRVIKMSSPRLNIVITSGAIIGSLCCILTGIDYHLMIDAWPAKIICQLRQALVVVSFSLVYAPMVAKTWRVNQIFKLAGTKRVVIRDAKLLYFTSSLVLLDVAILLLRFFLDPVVFTRLVYLEKMTSSSASITYNSIHSDIIMAPGCTSKSSLLWIFVFIAVKLPVLLLGMRESWWTRGMILPQLNDSTSLTISAMTTIAMTTVYMAVSLGVRSHPTAGNIASVVCLWIATMSVTIVVFVPKLLLWKQTPKGHLTHRVSISSICSSAAVLQSFEQVEAGLVNAYAEIGTLKAFIKEKELNIEKLQTLLSNAEDNLAQIGLDPLPPGVVADDDVPDDPDNKYSHSNINSNNNDSNSNNNNNNNNNNSNEIKTIACCLPKVLTSAHVVRIPTDHVLCGCCDGNDFHYDFGYHGDCQCYCHHQLPQTGHQHHRHTFSSNKAKTRSYARHSSHPTDIKSWSCHEDSFGDIGLDIDINSNSSVDYQSNYPSEVFFNQTQDQKHKLNEIKNTFLAPVKNSNKCMIKNNISTPNLFDNPNRKETEVTVAGIDIATRRLDTDGCWHQRSTKRRRSSTPSVHSLEKLNRLRSDLNDALSISTSLKSEWTTELARATKHARRTHRRYGKERRQTALGIKQITDSIMASYDFRHSLDNQSYISDCLTSVSSEYSSDQRPDRGWTVSNNSKHISQGRQRSVDQGTSSPCQNTFSTIAGREPIYSTFDNKSSEDDYYNGKQSIPIVISNKAARRCSHVYTHFDTGKDSIKHGGIDISLNQTMRSSGLEHGTPEGRSAIKSDFLYPLPTVKIGSDEMYDTVSKKICSKDKTVIQSREGRDQKTGILQKNKESNRHAHKQSCQGIPGVSSLKGQVTFADFDLDKHSAEADRPTHTSFTRIAFQRSQSDNELLDRLSSGRSGNRHLMTEEVFFKRIANDHFKGQERFKHSQSEKDLGIFKPGNSHSDAPSGLDNNRPSRQIRFQRCDNQDQNASYPQEQPYGRQSTVESVSVSGMRLYLGDQGSSCDSFA